jgi:hypothetical protein
MNVTCVLWDRGDWSLLQMLFLDGYRMGAYLNRQLTYDYYVQVSPDLVVTGSVPQSDNTHHIMIFTKICAGIPTDTTVDEIRAIVLKYPRTTSGNIFVI